MTTLAQLARQVKAVQPSDTLILTPTLARWYATHDELAFKPEHVELVASLLRGEHKVDRTARFGPSGRGACPRQQLLRFLGTAESGPDAGLKHVFWDGHHMHMITQLILLDSGLADAIEVEVNVPQLRSRGSIDFVGTHPDGWRYGGDVKTTSASETSIRETQALVEAWAQSSDWTWPEDWPWFAKHMVKAYLQVSSYLALSDEMGMGLKKFVLLYVCKGSDRAQMPLREVVVERFPKIMDWVTAEVDYLNDHVDNQQLPPMLNGCIMRHGKAYTDCAYRSVCADAHWPTPPPSERSVFITVPS